MGEEVYIVFGIGFGRGCYTNIISIHRNESNAKAVAESKGVNEEYEPKAIYKVYDVKD